jgi:UDP-glucose 4-epimerase
LHVLVTGGAGFIGSHLTEALVAQGHDVRVLDDLFAGRAADVPEAARLLVGSVTDEDAVRQAVDDIEIVFHQAAHGAVLRSLEDPLLTHAVNATGTLSVLKEARAAGVRRFIFASSSSVYGGGEVLPTRESAVLKPLSPYAVSKLAAEHYCRVYSDLFDLETVSLRYFNVFGPRQRPDSRYAAVIPRFLDALRNGRDPTVFGDGLQTRDFTFVSDVVRANLLAATAPASKCAGRVYNVAPGRAVSVLQLLTAVSSLFEVDPQPRFEDARPGDVRQSLADPSAATLDLGFTCEVPLETGLRRTMKWLVSEAPEH